MYLFGRSRTIAPAHTREAMASAVEAGARVAQLIGLPVYTWTPMFSPGVGTVLWSARVSSLSELEATADKYAADEATMEWTEQQNHLYEGPTNDTLTEVLHGTPAGEPGPWVSIVQAQWAPGKAAEAMTVGVEIVDTVARLTGWSPLFGRSLTGAFAGVGWITSFPDMGAYEASNRTMAGDSGWQDLMNKASTCYLPGAATMLMRRLV
jgi:hypothetical protein